MTDLLLAIDQGSSSSRAVLFDAGLAPVAAASRPLATALPGPGLVEHDPAGITASVLGSMSDALTTAGARWTDVASLGIAAQTETFVVWDARTGEPVYPAISWRDTRAAGLCAKLRADGRGPVVRASTGLPLEPAFSAPKLRWLLDEVPGAQQAAAAGRLLFGDVGCWLTWRLSGGTAHLTEPSLASRTMLFGLADGAWNEEMLDLFGVPAAMLPAVGPTAGRLAVTDQVVCGGAVPVTALAGDQQAALFGHRCWEEGQAKLTLGTGAFVWCNAGPRPPADPPPGVVASCAWRFGTGGRYALEGFVPNAGSVTTWLRGLGVLGPGEWPAIRPAAFEAAPGAGPWCVPALFGLGTPDWTPVATAQIGGLTASSTGADIAEAALAGVAHQVADAIDAAGAGLAGPLGVIKTDGGLSRNDSLLAAIAGLTGLTLERSSAAEVTALGAASLAAIGAGLADRETLARRPAEGGQLFSPAWPAGQAAAARAAWRERLGRVLGGHGLGGTPS
ncbi:MAG TPA: FGGY family carbohydrate kinase [Streptosporangiaceae bacterium]